MKDFKIASLLKKLQQFCQTGGFFLLMELHREGSVIIGATPSSFHKVKQCLLFKSVDQRQDALVQNNSIFARSSGFGRVVELHRKGSAINGASPSSFVTNQTLHQLIV